MKTYTLERAQVIERPRAETFAFFSDAFNLERITPSFLSFRILTEPPIKMEPGAILEYELGLFGARFRWKTLIEEWNPEESFVDLQLKGPYALWRHTHTFEVMEGHRTLVRDYVQYRLPLGPLGRIAHALFVKMSLNQIFDYRAKMTAQLLAPSTGQDSSGQSGMEDEDANRDLRDRRAVS